MVSKSTEDAEAEHLSVGGQPSKTHPLCFLSLILIALRFSGW